MDLLKMQGSMAFFINISAFDLHVCSIYTSANIIRSFTAQLQHSDLKIIIRLVEESTKLDANRNGCKLYPARRARESYRAPVWLPEIRFQEPCNRMASPMCPSP
jgi:hypothetical protein